MEDIIRDSKMIKDKKKKERKNNKSREKGPLDDWSQ